MSDVKITALPTASTVTTSTVLPTVNVGTDITEQATVSQLANALFSSVSSGTYGSSTYAPVVSVDSLGRITAISQTAISGGGGGSTAGVFNVRNYGAVGDGTTNDYAAINSALVACCAFLGGKGGTLYFPSGVYYIGTALTLVNRTGNITVLGDGPKTSVIKSAAGVSCINFNFDQVSAEQPYAPTIANLGFRCAGAGPSGTGAVVISYNVPGGVSNYHLASGPTITNCEVRSVDTSLYWVNGIDITSAWNTRIVDCFISGYSDGNWNNLTGVGIFFHKSCVNSSVVNTQTCFFRRGLKFDATTVPSQGLTVTDCNFIAVTSAGYFDCAGGLGYNLGSITWTGGIVDLRIAGTASGAQAFYAKNVDDVIISDVEFVTDTISVSSYGVYLDTCTDVSISNSVFYGFAGYASVYTVNTCSAIQVLGNRFVLSTPQLNLSAATSGSLYRDSILQSTTDSFTDAGTNNIVEGALAGVTTVVYRNTDQSIPNSTETLLTWTTELIPSQYGIWALSPDPGKMKIPTGAKKVQLTVNIRWSSSILGGYREVKIKDDNGSEVWASSSIAALTGDQSLTTPVIPVVSGMTCFTVTVTQTTGGACPVRGVKGTNFTLKVIA